jgi:hypothetical protein
LKIRWRIREDMIKLGKEINGEEVEYYERGE